MIQKLKVTGRVIKYQSNTTKKDTGMTMLTSDIHGVRREITRKSSLENLKISKPRGELKLETQHWQDQET